jgi:hypothetical protein
MSKRVKPPITVNVRTRKGAPTNRAGTPDSDYLEVLWPFAKPQYSGYQQKTLQDGLFGSQFDVWQSLAPI